MPHGPPSKPKQPSSDGDRNDRSASDLGKDYAGMITAVEAGLCAVEGLDSDEAAKNTGKREGAAYCWKNALGEANAEASGTTSISRACRRSATWLKDIAKTKDRKLAAAATWKLLHYVHPQAELAKATPPQLSAMLCFSACQKSLTRGQLLLPRWVHTLLYVAIKQAETTERAASAASVVKWTSWFLDGPASG